MADNIKDGPVRTLTHVVGHDADGKGGKQTIAGLLSDVAETVSDGDNAGAVATLEVGDAVVAVVTPAGQFRFTVPLHEDDQSKINTDFAEEEEGGDNAAASTVLAVGGAVVAAVTGEGQFRFAVPLHEDDLPFPSTVSASSSQFLVSQNEMWSWWVYPRVVEDEYGTQFWGSVGKQEGERAGPIFIGRRKVYGGAAEKTIIKLSEEKDGPWADRGWIDDHNRPAPIINPNPDAIYPLMAWQGDHGAFAYLHYWRSETMDPADLVYVGKIENGAGLKSYGQVYLHPDGSGKMIGLYRDGGSSVPYWAFAYRATESAVPDDWSFYADRFDGNGLYVLMIPRLDQLGFWLVFYGHPGNAPDPTIKMAKLNWDWSLEAVDGTEISADLRSGGNINPHDETEGADFTVVASPTASRKLRLCDAREYDDGTVRIVFADFASRGKVNNEGVYKLATVDVTTADVEVETICDCGGKIEEEVALYDGQYVQGSGVSSYIAGACLTDRPNEVFCTRWWNTYGDAVLAVKSNEVWDLSTVDRSTGKIARPEGHVRNWWDTSNSSIREEMTSRVSYWRGVGPHGGYSMFYDFNADRITVDLTAFRSTWK